MFSNKPVDYTEKDAALQQSIIDALVQRHTINVNRQTYVLRLSPELEDVINPCVTVTKAEIKKLTGRTTVRPEVIEDYRVKLSRALIDVTQIDADTLKVCITPVRTSDNEFRSLTELREKNQEELAERPELGASPY